jgi:hypothetical protein
MDDPYLQSQLACFGAGAIRMPRDTRPIKRRWQREKSVKMMKSLKGDSFLSSLYEPFLTFSDTEFGHDPAPAKMAILGDATRAFEVW